MDIQLWYLSWNDLIMRLKTSKTDTQDPKPGMPEIINRVCILNIKICEYRTDKSESSTESHVKYVMLFLINKSVCNKKYKAILAHLYVCGSVFVPYSE